MFMSEVGTDKNRVVKSESIINIGFDDNKKNKE